MTDHEKLVMRNIIYAVETGGQVYGQKDYADFTEAYTNSSAEHAITIGAGQWYGNEARTLLLKIKTTDAATFSKYDTAGVAADLNKTDWSNYQLSKPNITLMQKLSSVIPIIKKNHTAQRCLIILLIENKNIFPIRQFLSYNLITYSVSFSNITATNFLILICPPSSYSHF